VATYRRKEKEMKATSETNLEANKLLAKMNEAGYKTLLEWAEHAPRFVRLNEEGYRDPSLMNGCDYLTLAEIRREVNDDFFPV